MMQFVLKTLLTLFVCYGGLVNAATSLPKLGADKNQATVSGLSSGRFMAVQLHIALHGCQQNTSDVKLEFVQNAGNNHWAEANNIVVIYPQTGKGSTNSCWDWWGYDSATYAKKSGPQMMAIKDMVDRVTSIK